MSDNEKLLTAEEMAKRLKCTAEWVLQQVRAGRIPCIKFNRRVYRFHWPTVLKALERL
jgi:excisionase family DNA binding protein